MTSFFYNCIDKDVACRDKIRQNDSDRLKNDRY